MTKQKPDHSTMSWKEPVLVLAAMVISAIVTLTISLRMLRDTDLVEKSGRDVGPSPLRGEPLPIPEVPVLPPRDEKNE